MRDSSWREKEYSFFSHKNCEFFPCHKIEEGEDFNCLFCYCPLYALGKKCGGNFKISENGFKDCSGCNIPHKRENYERILSKYGEISELVKNQL